jgi:hypothetical protein
MGAVIDPRPDITRAVTRGAARWLRQAGFVAVEEMVLASGRRADLVALAPDDAIWIIEVKSGLEDYRSDHKWSDYGAYCDAFVFAVSPAFPLDVLDGEPGASAAGLILADAHGGDLIRPPQRTPLAPARRRAMTLAFARLASARLMALRDPLAER